jgi:hypothetical protein
MVPQARPWSQPLAQTPAAVRPRIALRAVATAARTAVVRLVVVVVAQAEEPDEPQDEQAHVENAESHHEDPPLGTDSPDRSSGDNPAQS